MKDIFVGQKASRQKTMTKQDVELFTKLSGDNQALHYDTSLAKRLGHKAPLVQGGVITGLFNAIIAHDLPGPGSVFLNVNWNFRRAVCIGDTVTAEVEVTSIRQDKPVITLKTTMINQDNKLVLDGTAVVYIRNINV